MHEMKCSAYHLYFVSSCQCFLEILVIRHGLDVLKDHPDRYCNHRSHITFRIIEPNRWGGGMSRIGVGDRRE